MSMPRAQFSLKTMLWLVAVVAVAAAALSDRSWRGGLLILLILMSSPAVAVIGIMQGRGPCRAFAIGTLCPSLIGLAAGAQQVFFYLGWGGSMLGMADDALTQSGDMLRFKSAVLWIALVVSGLCSAITSWLISPTARTSQPSGTQE